QAPAHVAAPQEAGERLEVGLRHQARQQLHQDPGERLLVQGRGRRHGLPAEDLAVGAPEKAPGQLDASRRGDAAVSGQRHLQPLGDAVALHQEGLLLERAQRVGADPFEDRLGELLGTVAVEDQEAWTVLARHAPVENEVTSAAATASPETPTGPSCGPTEPSTGVGKARATSGMLCYFTPAGDSK